jgi:adenine-specific DNA-methyltransferase
VPLYQAVSASLPTGNKARTAYLHCIKLGTNIDPPYNTGNDFVYEDDFAQSTDEYLANSGQYDEDGNRLVQNTESNGRFHTDWLNMMYPRLKLAKDLLSDDGVIFISIDDNEQANIKKVCDEIFGESNCIGPIIQNKLNAKNDTLNIQKNHEFILIYRKSCIYANGSRVLPTLINKEFKAREIFEDNGEFYYINDTITTRGEGGTLNASLFCWLFQYLRQFRNIQLPRLTNKIPGYRPGVLPERL